MKLIGTTMKHPHRHLCVATLFFLILSLSRRAEGLDLSLQSGFVLEGDLDEIYNTIPEAEEAEPDEPQKPKLSNKEIYANLKKYLASIKESCGQVCDTKMTGEPGKYYPVIQKEVNCKALFSNPDIDRASEFQYPPTKIPKYLLPDFTYDGKIELEHHFRDDADGVTHSIEWNEWLFTMIQAMYDEDRLSGPYGISNTRNIIRHIDEHLDVKGKHFLVMGSQTPWIELILLNKGAKKVTTFDYVKMNSARPEVEVLTPDELSEKFINEDIRFDGMVTFSSLEHSGLGRYGDMLNPWGDLITMARAWCLVKPGGLALVGVPTGPDKIVFNSDKVYGPVLYSHIFANWKQLYTETNMTIFKADCPHCYQPLHVIERI